MNVFLDCPINYAFSRSRSSSLWYEKKSEMKNTSRCLFFSTIIEMLSPGGVLGD